MENKENWNEVHECIINNGWVLIEDDNFYPRNIIDCWFICDNDIYLGYYTTRNGGYFVNGGDDIERQYVTHYMPIKKPQPPIY